jgi:tetratricopeptide (TPR) repeat protein
VRITAQLIRADNGLQIWAENYDRDLTDIFAVQEDIARAITTSLRMPLGLKPGENLVNNRAIDIDSYDQYLRAKALVRARADIPDEVIANLEQLVAHRPDYAPAWALLAGAYRSKSPGRLLRMGSIEQTRQLLQDEFDRIDRAAQTTVQLDPMQASAYAALADSQHNRGHWAASEELFKKSLALDPNDPNALYNYSLLLNDAGRIKEVLNIRERVRTLEPLSALYTTGYAISLINNGRNAEALMLLQENARTVGFIGTLAESYAIAGRYSDAADALLRSDTSLVDRSSLEHAAQFIRAAPAKVANPRSLPQLEAELGFVYAFIGAMDRYMEWPERALQIGFPADNTTKGLWRPYLAPLRKTERFKTYVRKAGLVDYWKARGWPDLCKPVGADDFACD